MRSRVRSQCSGLLLLEASLTVAVIAVSLVFLTRSLAAGFRALKQARQYEAALLVAERQLGELECSLQMAAEQNQQAPIDRAGDASTPQGAFRWEVRVAPFAGPYPTLQLDTLKLTVREEDQKPLISLTTIVPHAWTEGRLN